MTASRIIVVSLVVVNVLAAFAGVLGLRYLHDRPEPLAVAEYERRLGERLSHVSTPEQMRQASAELAHLSASANSLVQQAFHITDRALFFAITTASLNVVFIGVGAWYARAERRKISNQGMRV